MAIHRGVKPLKTPYCRSGSSLFYALNFLGATHRGGHEKTVRQTSSILVASAMKDKNKQREFQRRWLAKRRHDFFHDKACVLCGSTEKLELDHIDRTLKKDHKVWSWSKKRRDEEIRKCQVLCKRCHIKKTNREKSEHVVHGTLGMYKSQSFKCRCVPCRKANATYEHKRRQSH